MKVNSKNKASLADKQGLWMSKIQQWLSEKREVVTQDQLISNVV